MLPKKTLSELRESIPTNFFIPPQPEILKQLHLEMANVHTNSARIEALLTHDVAISATILKTVNSPYFNLRNKVQSISHAISIMGIKPTIDLTASFLLRKEFEERNISFPRFWDSASTVADLSAFIAKRLSKIPTDVAFTLGLFHDVGIPLMAQQYPDYLSVLKQANESSHGIFTDTEDAHYQVDHAIVACVVTHEWGISESIRDIILYHHDVNDFYYFDKSNGYEHSKLLSILKVAEYGNRLMRTGLIDPDWHRFSETVTSLLAINEDDIKDMIAEFQALT